MSTIARLKAEESILLVVDAQERLVPAMFEAERVVRSCALLALGARQLEVPIVVTEHNPSRLGPTVPAVAEALGEFEPIAKMLFSACTDQTVAALDALRGEGRSSVVLCGLESHVCVLQSALDLLEAGYRVFLPANAVSSRYASDKISALARLHGAGAVPASAEMMLYEWMRDASSPAFKVLLPHIK